MVEGRQAKARLLLSNLGYQFLSLGLETLAQHLKAKTEAVIEKLNSG
jgi:hypothetical protein